jgi:hypothetical protein
LILLALLAVILGTPRLEARAGASTVRLQADDPNPPDPVVKLVFVHHSTGEAWLADGHGGLGVELKNNRYFVSDTNYGWGPDSIGDRTDIGHWYTWFRGSQRDTYTAALYVESSQHSSYTRRATDPGGENEIILFKSCFPNSNLGGSPSDPPTAGSNPLRNQDAGSEHMTVGNAKGIYNDLLVYFQTRQDKLFVVVTAPPLAGNETSAEAAANARALNNWLVNDWLDAYPYANVAVFDFFNVLTSNGGSANTNDLGATQRNHHRWWNDAEQHIQTVANSYSSYPSDAWDSHPTAAGDQKATAEFVPLLNVFYHRWKTEQTTPTATRTATPSRTRTATPTRTPTATATGTPTATPTCASGPGVPLAQGWNLVSLLRAPGDTSVAAVLCSIRGQLVAAFAYDAAAPGGAWRIHAPDAPSYVSDLTAIDERMGFWVQVDAACTLACGGAVATGVSIPLYEGWNLVGYPASASQTVALALDSIDSQYDLVYAYDTSTPADPWRSYAVGAAPGENTLTTFDPGHGYWIRATEDCTLTY